MRFRDGAREMAKHLTTFAVAEILHVDPGSVANWIDQGLLRAHRTPGGHRRVESEDLVSFLRKHKMPIPGQLDPSPVRILIVDDNPATARSISEAIQEEHPDYEVLEAHDGFTAGTILGTLRPHVVILDLQMPGMDGFEVCRIIKSQSATRHAEVVAMTGCPLEDAEESILEMGARICLSKPLDMELLLKEVDASL